MAEDKQIIVKTGNTPVTVMVGLVLAAAGFYGGVQYKIERAPEMKLVVEGIPQSIAVDIPQTIHVVGLPEKIDVGGHVAGIPDKISVHAGQSVPLENGKEYLTVTPDGKVYRVFKGLLGWETVDISVSLAGRLVN